MSEELVIKPEQGTALLFEHHLLHEGSEIVCGRKYVIGSDVMYRRSFK